VKYILLKCYSVQSNHPTKVLVSVRVVDFGYEVSSDQTELAAVECRHCL
jgi:hypothetical protein